VKRECVRSHLPIYRPLGLLLLTEHPLQPPWEADK
jgi:hypothetical protein